MNKEEEKENKKNTDEIVNELIVQVEKSIKDGKISAEMIFPLCILTMQLAERLTLKGSDKKELVMSVMNCLVNKYKADIGLLVLLPGFIDMAIELDKDHLHIEERIKNSNCCNVM